jgi:pantetheine-phosphate adenylyltransferase
LTVVLYPGSFDPVHNGHVEIVEIAARLFDEVVVAAMRNPQKGEPLFSLTERKAMLDESFAHLDNVRVTMFSTLVGDLAKELGADFIVRVWRGSTESELRWRR